MEAFVKWVSSHALTVLIILGVIYAIAFVLTNRKSLFYKE
ncbi:hypothetical protein DFP98_14361 [Cohnella phaseoli]|uniref:Uncharacterized protein n=1 Tax=Cohnella phaseoli TaxID=456490 RepID=A0A3D9I176_9BACL|nr:hypothetical protein DFP98_14361 [Cohnella phaseoli]